MTVPNIFTTVPNWKPLHARLGESRCQAWMWMFRANGLEFYKHRETRRYLALDARAQAHSVFSPFEPIDFTAAYVQACRTTADVRVKHNG